MFTGSRMVTAKHHCTVEYHDLQGKCSIRIKRTVAERFNSGFLEMLRGVTVAY